MPLRTRSQGRDLILIICLSLLFAGVGWTLFGYFRAVPELREANAALIAHDIARATKQFDTLVAAHPATPEIYAQIEELCQRYEQWNLAETYARRGVQACKYAPDNQRALLYVALATALSETETQYPQEQAIDAAEHALRLAPHDPIALNEVGYLLANNDRDLPRAQTCLTEALRTVQQSPEEPDQQALVSGILDSYGWLMYKQGAYPAAIDALTQATNAIPSEYALPSVLKVMYYHLGAAYSKAGQTEEARQALLVALQYDPGYSLAKTELDRLSTPSGSPPNPPAAKSFSER